MTHPAGSHRDETPLAPCAAYRLVAQHVPETYFWKRQPDTGLRLTAISNRDCTGSVWYMPDWLAREIAVHLAPLPGVSVLLAAYGPETEEAK